MDVSVFLFVFLSLSPPFLPFLSFHFIGWDDLSLLLLMFLSFSQCVPAYLD